MYGTSLAFGPSGNFVIRAHRYGVPGMLHTTWSIVDLVQRMARLLSSEKRWTIEVRRASDDPWGPVVHSEVVPDKAAVATAMSRLERSVRSGEIGR